MSQPKSFISTIRSFHYAGKYFIHVISCVIITTAILILSGAAVSLVFGFEYYEGTHNEIFGLYSIVIAIATFVITGNTIYNKPYTTEQKVD